MRATDDLVRELVEWTCNPDSDRQPPSLSANFLYDDGLEALDREGFLVMRSGSGAIVDLQILMMVCCQADAAIMFEGRDTVTDLWHRFCWFIEFDAYGVCALRTCHSQLRTPSQIKKKEPGHEPQLNGP